MKVEVKTIFYRGKPRPKDIWKADKSYEGRLRVREERLHLFGRTVVTATLIDQLDERQPPVLPMLADAQLIWAADDVLRIRGSELVDGIAYGQTWVAKVLGC